MAKDKRLISKPTSPGKMFIEGQNRVVKTNIGIESESQVNYNKINGLAKLGKSKKRK